MAQAKYSSLFTDKVMNEIFPSDRADHFFDALFGDPSEGSFDIRLKFNAQNSNQKLLQFDIQLTERPGKCLACNLTYGLPDVFSRHPVINIKGVVKEIEKRINGNSKCNGWSLGHTSPISKNMHIIPLVINLS